MSDTIDNIRPEEKVYKDRFFGVATFLGGPLVAGYLFAENFKVFGQSELVKPTWIITILSTFVIFGISFLIPEDINFPNQIIPIGYSIIAVSLFKKYQEQQVNAHLNKGGMLYSWWRVIGISIVGMLITLAIVFTTVYAFEAVQQQNIVTKSYGASVKNEIDFDSVNISEQEIDELAQAFYAIGFFDQEYPQYLYISKTHNKYEIFISAAEGITNDKEAIQWYSEYRTLLNNEFPQHDIEFKLVVNYLDNVVKVIK
ncbi:MAG: hypothetical protein N4A35_00180 [Flavobacteriales bacterium]|jgi:hypothetical protein|nr:hypothetical protein [Flavobacteriales bacterium]